MNFIKKKNLYTWYARPVLEGATQVWSPIQKRNIDKIVLTKVFHKMSGQFRKFVIAGQNRQAKSFESRRIKFDLSLFFKLSNEFIDMDMSDIYRLRKVYRNHNRTLPVNYGRTDKMKYYWLHRIATHWNVLDGARGMGLLYIPQFICSNRLVRNVNFISRGSIYWVQPLLTWNIFIQCYMYVLQ